MIRLAIAAVVSHTLGDVYNLTNPHNIHVNPMNIQSLSISERILLAEQLWDSVRTRSDEVKIPAELLELLDDRLASLAADENRGDNWETVKKRIMEK